MDDQSLKQLVQITAQRYRVYIDQSGVDALVRRNSTPPLYTYPDTQIEQLAYEGAITVIFTEAQRLGQKTIDASIINKIFDKLCPLPPFC